MKTATIVKDNLKDFLGHAALYRLSEPMEIYEFVVVSKVNTMFSGPETYIFPADKNGKIKNWEALPGSQRGEYSHADVLNLAGYTVIGSN